jgi:hypothetical protein
MVRHVRHPTDEHIRVRSGEFLVGSATPLDASKTMKMAAGDRRSIAAKMHRFRDRAGRDGVEHSCEWSVRDDVCERGRRPATLPT